MGRPRKITDGKVLLRMAKDYIDSISRTVDVTERVPTEDRDDKGHVIYKEQPVHNDRGEVVRTREFLVPPSVAALCLYLGIHTSTWARWRDREEHQELAEAVDWIEDVFLAWKSEQLLTRKNVRGLIFDLENNHGFTRKVEVEAGEKTRKAQALTMEDKLALLREMQGRNLEELTDGGGD